MMKRILLMLSLLWAGMCSADWLYWELTFSEDWGDGVPTAIATSGSTDLTAYLFATKSATASGGTLLTSVDENKTAVEPTVVGASGEGYDVLLAADISAYDSSWNFYIELAGENSWYSETINFANAVSWGHTQSTLTADYDKPWNPTMGTWSAVPEPTSGLLMLVGMGLLALRRKRA